MQQSRAISSEIVKCQNPPKLRKLTCVMWKDVPVLFFPKSREKRLDKQAWKSTPTPPPSVPPNDVKRILAVFSHVAQGVPISCIQIQHFFSWEEQWGGGGGGENFRPVCQVFSPCF